MAFPPVFNNVWDTTQPPDTQLANLLGLDIRNLKTDIMQRMSTLSGTLANRPTPETVNAVWGGSGFGLIYLSTDTNQIFQWNGTNWVVISVGSGSQKFLDLVSHNLTINSAGFQFGSTVTIPAGTLLAGSLVNVFVSFLFNYFSGAQPLVSLLVGSQQMFTFPVGNTTQGLMLGSFSLPTTASEVGAFQMVFNTNPITGGFSGIIGPYQDTLDTAANPLTITVKVQGFAGSNAQLFTNLMAVTLD